MGRLSATGVSRRGRSLSKIRALLCIVLLSVAACGDAGESSSDNRAADEPTAGSEELSATIALPFASCLSHYPIYVAEDRGYLADEGLDLTIEIADGSGAANQAVLTDRADVAVTAPNEFLAATESADLTSFYSFYQDDTFGLLVDEDSDIESVDDVRGTTVAYSTPSGGDYSFMRGFLDSVGGLESGTDYEELAVGDGANYGLALRDGSVDVIAGSFFVEIVVESQGTDLRALSDPGWPRHPDIFFIARSEWLAGNAAVVEALGRATAKGSAYGAAHPEDTIEICSGYFSEETADPELARAIYDRITEIYSLPPSADGLWGFTDMEVLGDYIAIVEEVGVVPEGSSVEVFTNDYVDAFNDFDEAGL